MMELDLQGIKDKESWKKAGIKLPAYDVEKIAGRTRKSPVWLHFGAGNIFRIFLGGIADRLIEEGSMDKGIVCAETFDFDIVDKIYRPFDNLVLAVTLKADGNNEKAVFGSLAEAVKADPDASHDWNRLKEIFAGRELQMVSFTITEKGYSLKNASGDYAAFIKKDIDGGPERAKSAMAVVCALLYERYKAGRYPLAVVSMDNCSHNGEKLKDSVVSMADEWAARGFVPAEFAEYLKNENEISFPWSVIDKITPRPAQTIAAELKKAGIKNIDPVITSKNTYIAPYVNAEAPQYLVIEDHFPNGRPELEKAGVYMTDRDTVNKVEKMKVTTCLNPLHTALAVYGCLLGYHFIADEMKDTELKALAEMIGIKEGMPVVTDPLILSPENFVKEVLYVRLPNPCMPDTPQRIATDTSQKAGIRYGETIKSYVEKYGTAESLTYIPLAIAGWCRYLMGVDDNGNRFELSPDPMLDELTAALDGIEIGGTDARAGQLRSILSNEHIFGIDLYQAGIGEKIERMFWELAAGKGAVRKTLKKYTGVPG